MWKGITGLYPSMSTKWGRKVTCTGSWPDYQTKCRRCSRTINGVTLWCSKLTGRAARHLFMLMRGYKILILLILFCMSTIFLQVLNGMGKSCCIWNTSKTLTICRIIWELRGSIWVTGWGRVTTSCIVSWGWRIDGDMMNLCRNRVCIIVGRRWNWRFWCRGTGRNCMRRLIRRRLGRRMWGGF